MFGALLHLHFNRNHHIRPGLTEFRSATAHLVPLPPVDAAQEMLRCLTHRLRHFRDRHTRAIDWQFEHRAQVLHALHHLRQQLWSRTTDIINSSKKITYISNNSTVLCTPSITPVATCRLVQCTSREWTASALSRLGRRLAHSRGKKAPASSDS